MALSSAECWQVAQQPTFQARVRYSLNKAATAVLAEPGATPGHNMRVAFARKILAGDYNVQHLSMAVWTSDALKASGNINNETTSGVPDTELQNAFNSLFSALAGYDAAGTP